MKATTTECVRVTRHGDAQVLQAGEVTVAGQGKAHRVLTHLRCAGVDVGAHEHAPQGLGGLFPIGSVG